MTAAPLTMIGLGCLVIGAIFLVLGIIIRKKEKKDLPLLSGQLDVLSLLRELFTVESAVFLLGELLFYSGVCAVLIAAAVLFISFRR